MKTSVAVIILFVCLSGITINETEGIKIKCRWGGCPFNKTCYLCCDHVRQGCIGGKCRGFLCVCDCPAG